MTWPTALGMVFRAGVLFLAISVTPLRERLATANWCLGVLATGLLYLHG